MSQIVFADSNWILQRVRNRKSVSRKTINEEKKKAKKNETGQQRGIKGAVEEWSMQENEDNSTAFIQKWAVKKIKRAQTLRNRLRDAHQFIILGVSTSLQFVVVTNLSGRSHQWPLVLWRGVLLYKRELASCTASCGRAVCWCLLLWVKWPRVAGGGGVMVRAGVWQRTQVRFIDGAECTESVTRSWGPVPLCLSSMTISSCSSVIIPHLARTRSHPSCCTAAASPDTSLMLIAVKMVIRPDADCGHRQI